MLTLRVANKFALSAENTPKVGICFFFYFTNCYEQLKNSKQSTAN